VLGTAITGVGSRRPAGEEVECLSRAAAGLGAEDGQAQAAIGRELHDLVVELKIPNGGMVQPLATGLVVEDVVRGPPLPEWLAAGRQLSDEVGKGAVVRISARFRAEGGDHVFAVLSQSVKNCCAAGSRKVKRAEFGGCSWLSNSGAYRARPSALAVR
jgi:hypothetical protein